MDKVQEAISEKRGPESGPTFCPHCGGSLVGQTRVARSMVGLSAYCQRLVQAAQEGTATPAAWERVYHELFPTVRREAEALDPTFDWYDPDGSYEEDVRAFVDALAGHVERTTL